MANINIIPTFAPALNKLLSLAITSPLYFSSASAIDLFNPSNTSPPILFILVFQLKPATPSPMSTK